MKVVTNGIVVSINISKIPSRFVLWTISILLTA